MKKKYKKYKTFISVYLERITKKYKNISKDLGNYTWGKQIVMV